MLSQDFVCACKVYRFSIPGHSLKTRSSVTSTLYILFLRHYTTCCNLFSCLPFSKVRIISKFSSLNIPQHMPRVTINYALFFNSLYKWIHTTCTLLCLASFAQHSICETNSAVTCSCSKFTLISLYNIPLYQYTQFICLFYCGWTLDCFQF